MQSDTFADGSAVPVMSEGWLLVGSEVTKAWPRVGWQEREGT